MISMSPTIEAALTQLRNLREAHFTVVMPLMQEGHKYKLDIHALAVIDRSLSLLRGFCDLVGTRNMIAAAPLLRCQLDNGLRFFASNLVEDPHEFSGAILKGIPVRRVKDRNGKPSAYTARIGVINCVTGTQAPIGEYMSNGYKLAMEDLQKKGIKVELVIEDDTGKPQVSMSAMEKLVTRDRVAGVVGPYSSACANAVSKLAEKYKVPRMCFVNKLDRTGADFFRCVDMMVERLNSTPLVLQLPIGAESDFLGVVDLVGMRALTWRGETKIGEDYEVEAIPADMQDQADEYREKLLETLAEADETEIYIGDIYTVGSARVQVSGPRMPCTKQNRKLKLADFQKHTLEALRTGFYLRVLTPGLVAAGNEWQLEARPPVTASLHTVNACAYQAFDPLVAQQLVNMPALAPPWVRFFRRKL